MKLKLLFTMIITFIFYESVAQNPTPVPGQYIVILKESAATPVIKKQKKNNNREQKFNDNRPERDKNLAKLKEVRQRRNIKESSVLLEYADVTVGFSAKLTDNEKKDLESDPDVDVVVQDYIFSLGPITLEPNPADVGINFNKNYEKKRESSEINSGPNSEEQTVYSNDHSKTFAQFQGCNINKAGGPADGASKSTWIWIMDTGIDTDHPDLNVQTNTQYARSFVFLEPTVDDLNGHGTHCAGIAAAKNNSIGVVGVSAGARVVPVKVLSVSGDGQWSWLLAGLNHVSMYDVPGDVVSMSLGAYPFFGCENSWGMLKVVITTLAASGTWVVMAAGNDGADASLHRPGCINGPKVLTVGSINCANSCASSSNFNPTVVDWIATGVSVYSTFKGGGYGTMSGTSMATPAVAGIVHSRNNYPNSGGTVTCRGSSYKIATR